MGEDSERIVKQQLSELDFRRWRILMHKIDVLDENRRELQNKMAALTRQSDELYIEMRKLWDFVKVESK